MLTVKDVLKRRFLESGPSKYFESLYVHKDISYDNLLFFENV